MLYTVINVGEKEYKARLNAKACVELEKKLGTNPLNIFVKMIGEGDAINLPSLGDLITILHASLQAYHHGISVDKAYEIYDAFVNEGNNIMDLVAIVSEIYKVSGLMPEEVKEETETIEKNA